jgi:hypothetical protein
MRNLALVLPLVAIALAGCGRDQGVPTSADNRAMDAASNRLDNAANELDRVDERLPPTNENGPPAKANGPLRPKN